MSAYIPKSTFYDTKNIIVGNAELPFSHCNQTGLPGWVLPGGYMTFHKEYALNYATELDKTISANLGTYKRKVLRG